MPRYIDTTHSLMKHSFNKLKVIDLFAGAGGFGLGFQQTNKFDLAASLEIDRWAVKTLAANQKNPHLILHSNINKFNQDKQILELFNEVPQVIIGGPPCQGFSKAGPMKDPNDPRNSLFKEFANWVKVLRPKVFVMENVTGILSRKNANGQNVKDIIMETFTELGYFVEIWILNAANFGVPQNRKRVFFVGNCFEKKISPPPITHFLDEKEIGRGGVNPAITVFDAIGDLPILNAGEGIEEAEYISLPKTNYQELIRGSSTILYNHVAMSHTKRLVRRYEDILAGKKWDEMSDDNKVRKRNGNGNLSDVNYNSNYRLLRGNRVSYTIPASFYSNFVHPTQPRNITAREAARLQSFPDSYVFKGKRTQISSKLLSKLGKESENYLSQYNQIGNAVPPLLAQAIAERIYSFLSLKELNS